jgi:hypothetical protein
LEVRVDYYPQPQYFPPRRRRDHTVTIALIAGGIVLILAIVLGFIVEPNMRRDRRGPANSACERHIMEFLAEPSEATFTDIRTSPQGDGKYLVTGVFDKGIGHRSSVYECLVRAAGDTWQVLNVDF